MRCGDLHLRIQDILETSFWFDTDTNKFNVQKVLASRNTQRQEEQAMLSTIRRQVTDSLPQAGNDQTTNIRQYACKAKWDGLYSRHTVSNKSRQHRRGKRNHNKQSTEAVQMWVRQALTHITQGLSCWTCN